MSDLPNNQYPHNENDGVNNKQQHQQYFHNNNNPFFEDVTDQRIRNPPTVENENDNQPQQQERTPRSSYSSSSRSVSSSPSEDQKWQYESIKQGEQQQIDKNQVEIGEGIAPKEVMKQKSQGTIRYKYCCKKCKHADRDKNQKACVCVVPRDQRRTHLGNQGCQTCGCNGCSKQDFIFRGEDPEYHPEDKKKQTKKKEQEKFEARNGCCKNCMKAFSKSGKSCICQVPQDVRKTKLSSTGCKICGCVGCNPQDKKSHHHHYSQRRTRRSRSRSQRRKQKHSKRSHSRQKKRRSKSRSPEIIDTFAMNFHNIDRSIIGSMIINEYQIDPALLGFGIPQRSSSYLFGRNRQK